MKRQSRSPINRVCLTAWIVATAVPNAFAVDGTPSWTFSNVNAPTGGGSVSAPSLAFDHYGTPSVAYSMGGGTGAMNTVYRSEFSGLGLWAHQSVSTGTGVGIQTALSFDRAERPTLAWINDTGDVKAKFDVGGTVVTAGMGVAKTNPPVLSLSHDLEDTLRGMYGGIGPGAIGHISQSGGTFSTGSLTTLTALSNIAEAELTTDHMGLRHVIARGDTTELVIASEPSFGGPWSAAVLPTVGEIYGAAIATNPTNGALGIAYTTLDGNTARLFYAELVDYVLETTEVDTEANTVYHQLDLAFDLSDGRPAIAFEREGGGNEELMFTYLDGASQWQTNLVDGTISLDPSVGGFQRKPSLAFDDYGTSYPAIAYINSDGSLDIAFDPPVPEPGTALLMGFGLTAIIFRTRRHGL